MQNQLLSQGMELMLLGMGVVFVFLTALVFATGVMSRIVLRFFPEPSGAAPEGQSPSAPSGRPDRRTLAIIEAAIAEHRGRRR